MEKNSFSSAEMNLRTLLYSMTSSDDINDSPFRTEADPAASHTGSASVAQGPSKPLFTRACRFLNGLISKVTWGKKTLDGPRHGNLKCEIIGLKNRERMYLRSITLKRYAEHLSGLGTYYFTHPEGASRGLIMLDIDCHHKGTLEGAIKCAQWIKAHVFANLYFEASTNGKGVHGYIILERKNTDAQAVKDWMKKLQEYLQGYQHLFDVEMIEIKGQPTTTQYQTFQYQGYRMQTYKVQDVCCGTLAKLPREILNRWDEFEATTTVDIAAFPFPLIVGAREQEERDRPVGSGGNFIGDWKPLEPLARKIMGERERVQVGEDRNVSVTVEDMAVLLAILSFCSRHMNVDGTLPTNRVMALWENMYSTGTTSRQWNARRYAAARNVLDQAGGIAWEDHHYFPGAGTACKWQLTDEILEEIEQYTKEQPDSAPLAEQGGDLIVGWSLDRKGEGEVIRPEAVFPSIIALPDADEIEVYLKAAA